MAERDREKSAPTRLRRLHRGDNVHAELPDQDVTMRNLGGIDVGQGQSFHMADLSVSAEIALGSVEVDIGRRCYEWSMRRVRIALDIENAEVIDGSYYRHELQEGDLHSAAEQAEQASRKRSLSGEAGIGGEAGQKGFGSLVAKLTGSLKGEGAREATSGSKTNVTPIIELVKHTGDRIWQAGGKEGDPRRPDTKDLRGAIVAPYRRLARSGGDGGSGATSEEVPTPLIRLRALDPTKPVVGRISVRAGRGDFVLDASRNHVSEAKTLLEALKQDKQHWLERRIAAEAALRRRVAELAAWDDRKCAGGNEIDLFCCAFVFEPEDEAEDVAP